MDFNIENLKEVIGLVREELGNEYGVVFICSNIHSLTENSSQEYKKAAQSFYDALKLVMTKNQPNENFLLSKERFEMTNYSKLSYSQRFKGTRIFRIFFLNCILESLDCGTATKLEDIVEFAYHKTKDNLETIYKNL